MVEAEATSPLRTPEEVIRRPVAQVAQAVTTVHAAPLTMGENQARVALAHNVTSQFKAALDAYARVHKQSCDVSNKIAADFSDASAKALKLTQENVQKSDGKTLNIVAAALRIRVPSPRFADAHLETCQQHQRAIAAAHDANDRATDNALKSIRNSETEKNKVNAILANAIHITSKSPVDRMKDLNDLFQSGFISDEQYQAKKIAILDAI